MKDFFTLFAIRNLMIGLPSRKITPNHKIDLFLFYPQKVFLECCEIGSNITVMNKM